MFKRLYFVFYSSAKHEISAISMGQIETDISAGSLFNQFPGMYLQYAELFHLGSVFRTDMAKY